MHLQIPMVCALLLALYPNISVATPRFDLSVGGVTRPSLDAHDINSVRSGLTWETPYLERSYTQIQQTLRIETAVGLHSANPRDIKDVSISPILHYQLNPSHWPDFVELGIGLTYISEQRWKPYNDMGSQFLFADRIGLGYSFGSTEISVNFYHISNAGLSFPNPGADMLLLRTSFKL